MDACTKSQPNGQTTRQLEDKGGRQTKLKRSEVDEFSSAKSLCVVNSLVIFPLHRIKYKQYHRLQISTVADLYLITKFEWCSLMPRTDTYQDMTKADEERESHTIENYRIDRRGSEIDTTEPQSFEKCTATPSSVASW
ncbi:hypothetical protein Fcan01_05700 [Folsomia candida]|uniref:Uncharacterized protein n=1 Tax=Folsomia candida TaxID=158441 RepID=A0A226EUL1_FOLCA|nr:hypothetical protein Fcan01_05700 [Folsomia candida]